MVRISGNMRVLVFGTSNSLLRGGWVAGLTEALGSNAVDNLSVGMCPSTRFAAHADIDWRLYDAVFFDSVPNDEVLLDNAVNPEILDSLLGQIFYEIARSAPLIVIGFCFKEFLHAPSAAFIRHQRLCAAVGAHFVDVRDLVLELGERRGRAPESLYDDHPAHPHRVLAYEIGHVIGHQLPELLSTLYPCRAARIGSPEPSAFSCASIDAPLFAGRERVSVGTRLMRKEFVRLRLGEKISFSPSLLIGLYVNLGTTNAVIRLHGEGVTRDVQSYFSSAFRSPFLLNFLPLPNDIIASSLSVEAEPSSKAAISRYSSETRADDEILVDLVDLCFYSPSLIASLPSLPIPETDAFHEQICSVLFSRPMARRLSTAFVSIGANPASPSLVDEARSLVAIANRFQSLDKTIDFYDCLIRTFDLVLDQHGHHFFHVELVRYLLNRRAWDLARERIRLIPPELKADGWPHCLLARALTAAGCHKDARLEWEELSLVNPNHPEALAALGKQ